jgi:hypothetical protein
VDGNNFVDTFGLCVVGGSFENVSINATNSSESGILVFDGSTFFKKVHVSGFKVGVKVKPGAGFVATRCEIFGKFATKRNVRILLNTLKKLQLSVTPNKSFSILEQRANNVKTALNFMKCFDLNLKP